MCRPFNADFMRGSRKKSPVSKSGEYGTCSSVVSIFFAKKSLTKLIGVLKHCREGEINFGFPFFGLFLLTAYTGCPRRNVKHFGRVSLMLNYTDITQNTNIQS
jgi:hypothetical protein